MEEYVIVVLEVHHPGGQGTQGGHCDVGHKAEGLAVDRDVVAAVSKAGDRRRDLREILRADAGCLHPTMCTV